MTKPYKKLARSQQRAYTVKLLKEQDGKCLLCDEPIDMKTAKGHRTDYALDHCHETGRIRGVLHRACNGMEGKVTHAVARWGGVGHNYTLVVARLKRLVDYLEREPKDYIYPHHKTPEEQAEARRVRRNTMAARRRAAAKAKEIGK